MTRKKITSSTFLFFLIIVLAAAVFRVTNLELVEFKADEAINLFLASRPLFGHPLPPGGTVSSVGVLNPPFFNYLLFPFTLISLDPKIISFFIGLLNSLAIGFFFLLIKRYYDFLTALIASLLFAFSPWAILFSRKIWTQNLVLPFLVMLFFSLHQIILDKKPKYWILYVAASLFLLQLHQSSFFFLLLLNGFLLVKRVKFHLPNIALGFFLGLLPALPYFVYVVNHLYTDPQAILVAKERVGSAYFSLIFFRPLQILSQGNFHFVMGDDILTFANRFPLAYNLRRIFYLEYLLLPLGMILFWKKFPKLRFLVYASLGLPIIYFFLHFEPFIHYFLVITPLLFLFLASVFAFFLRHSNTLVKTTTLLVLLALMGTSLAFNTAFFRFLNEQKALKGDYGPAFIITEQNTKKRLQPYQNDPDYQEMLLASYLPKHFFHGYMPVPKMLYSLEEIGNRLPSLEERLGKVPEDARVQNELLFFYTASPPTAETIELLKEKTQVLPGYQPIFDEVNKIFTEQNSK